MSHLLTEAISFNAKAQRHREAKKKSLRLCVLAISPFFVKHGLSSAGTGIGLAKVPPPASPKIGPAILGEAQDRAALAQQDNQGLRHSERSEESPLLLIEGCAGDCRARRARSKGHGTANVVPGAATQTRIKAHSPVLIKCPLPRLPYIANTILGEAKLDSEGIHPQRM